MLYWSRMMPPDSIGHCYNEDDGNVDYEGYQMDWMVRPTTKNPMVKSS
ncbi:MAG: hypothetical protein ACOX5R_01155 [bacterium]